MGQVGVASSRREGSGVTMGTGAASGPPEGEASVPLVPGDNHGKEEEAVTV